MSVFTWLALVYALVGLVCWRLFAGAIAWGDAMRYDRTRPVRGDWVWGVVVGFFGALVWPVVLAGPPLWKAGLWMLRPLERSPLTIGAERRARERAKARRLKDLERRNRQLEQKLGIGEEVERNENPDA